MTYFEKLVPIPEVTGKIVRQKSGDEVIISYEYDRTYDEKRGRSHSRYVRIGKVCPVCPRMMWPNENYIRYFRSPDGPGEDDEDEDIEWSRMRGKRACTLSAGSYFAFRKVLDRMDLRERLEEHFGLEEAAFLVDLAVSEVIQGDSTRRYYVPYNESHPLFTRDMVMYSKQETLDRIHDLDPEDIKDFLRDWNRGRDKQQNLCVSYATVGKQGDWLEYWSPGTMEFVDGNLVDRSVWEDDWDPLDGESLDPDYVVAYDAQNRVPLFYEAIKRVPLIGVREVETLTDRLENRGYHKFRFLMDQGFYDLAIPRYLVEHGQDFLISATGDRSFALPVIREVKGTFEHQTPPFPQARYLPHTTVRHKLYDEDPDPREYCFHLFYDKKEEERFQREVRSSMDHVRSNPERYQDPEDRLAFLKDEYDSAGYFCLVTSDEMTADEALALFVGKDVCEQIMLRGNPYIRPREYFGGCPYSPFYVDEMKPGCAFVEFLALIILAQFYTMLKDEGCKYMYTPPGDLVGQELFTLENIYLYRDSGVLRWELLNDLDDRQQTALRRIGITMTELKRGIPELNKQLLLCCL